MSDDLISRQAAIDAFYKHPNITWTTLDVMEKIDAVPSAEPTLYGYKIEHLAYIAKVMEKEGVTAEYAARTFDDMSRVIKMVIEEAQERAMEVLYVIDSIENAFKSREDE